jgi:o-succinylbenzoate synthase
MRVTAVDVVPYALDFAQPYVTARGSLDRREMALVRVRTDGGLEGLGEAVPMTLRGSNTLRDVVGELRSAGEELVGLDLSEPVDEGARPLTTSLSPPAAAAIELARLDLAAKLIDQPLWQLLGAQRCEPVECNATLSAGGPAQVATDAERWAAQGFTAFKLKVGTLGDVGQVEAVRSAVGPDARIRVDANGAWSVDGAVARLTAMERHGLELAEQPAANLDDLAAVKARSSVPIAADESVNDADDAVRAVSLSACDFATVKLAKVGGVGAARRISAVLPVYLSSALDGPVGIAAAAHLAQVVAPAADGGLAHGLATQLLFSSSVAGVECEVRDGFLHPPTGPGLGVEIDDEALDRARL